GAKILLLKDLAPKKEYDIVIEATGSVGGFETSLSLTKPRGVLVLKSTIAAREGLNLSPVVVDEITILGSRCGQFAPAMRLLARKAIDVKPLISCVLPIDKALEGV
ncbi:theronine dehydrogenase-like Zn-dependent dehydrogenase, partial [Candidatus Gastranaerophilus sp. (ex Termes propinquus)]